MRAGSTLVEALVGLVLITIVITIFFTMTMFVFRATKLAEDTTKIYSFITFVQEYLLEFEKRHILDPNSESRINELFWGSNDPKKYPRVERLFEEEVKLSGDVSYKKITARIKVSENTTVEKVFLIGF